MGRNLKTVFLVAGFGALALFAGLRGYKTILGGTLLMLIAVGAAYLWNRFVFARLTFERTLNRKQVEFGAAVTMELTATNRKILPLFGLKIEDTISPGLKLTDAHKLMEIKDGAYNIFRDYIHLNWYERRRRSYELVPGMRGRFEFGTGLVDYSDPFGFFFNRKEAVFERTQLIVFPKVVPIKGVAALDTYLFGARPREGWIFTDPLNTVGTRAYENTDSARQINWKATARHGQLQVHVEKPSFDQQVNLILVQPPQLEWWSKSVSNNLEVAIMTAASLIHDYSRNGYQIQFGTNLVSKVHGLSSHWAKARRGRAQRAQLLTDLALLQNFSVEPSTKTLAGLGRRIKPGSTIVIISTAPGHVEAALAAMIRNLLIRSRVALLRVQKNALSFPKTEGIKEWGIEGGEPWDEVAALELS